MSGPCAKQIVWCEIKNLDTGRSYFGENDCEEPQETCPRGDLPPGIGYHLCKEICDQRGHAEERAIERMLEEEMSFAYVCERPPIKNAVAYVYGQTRICHDCYRKLRNAGINRIVLVNDSIVINCR